MRTTFAILGVVAILAFAGCQHASFSGDVLQINGTVHYETLEGGFWAVRSDDGTTYDPLDSLPEEFRVEGLRVKLEAKVRRDVATFHMVGPVVDVTSITRLESK